MLIPYSEFPVKSPPTYRAYPEHNFAHNLVAFRYGLESMFKYLGVL